MRRGPMTALREAMGSGLRRPAKASWLLLALIVWMSVATAVLPAAAQTTVLAQITVLDPQTIYDRAAPAVGVVRAMADGRTGIGTAFVIDRAGLLLTASHVARRADDLAVEFPGERALPARLVGYDARRDLALLRVSAPTALPAIEVAQDGLRAGEPVVVIGTPRGRPGVMTVGEIVTARASLPGLPRETLIRINAPIAPGNSGGPVLNAHGQVVGLVIARGNDGAGLAVSSSTILAALPALREGARVERPWIGIAGRSLTPDLVRERGLGVERGALIQDIVSESPAAAADLRSDDVIIALDGEGLGSWEDLLGIVAEREPGQRVRLTVVRGGARLNVEVTLGVRP
ncbi:MAG: S1C family serine protease [Armatimonadota bacterium]